MITSIAASATESARGFDVDVPLTQADATAYRANGFDFCIRYVGRDAGDQGERELSGPEAQSIFAGGLALMVVQHPLDAGTPPTANLGTQYGQTGASYARDAGIPDRVNLWLDLEGLADNVSADAVVAYCNAWFAAVEKAGYTPGLYVGAGCGLDAHDLYYRLTTTHYWQSLSGSAPDVAVRGYQLKQSSSPQILPDQPIDLDIAMADALGGTAIWAQPAA